jgi:uracil-DNA glycosylase
LPAPRADERPYRRPRRGGRRPGGAAAGGEGCAGAGATGGAAPVTALAEPPAAWAGLPFFARDWPALAARLASRPRPWQPAPGDIFRALALTPPDAVRAVILGQDPYHAPGRATGLAFGYPAGMRPDRSLANILAELADDLGIRRADGELSGWARQGVLLWNTVLTVDAGAGTAGSHRRLGWEALTAQVLARVAAGRPVAFLLWGAAARPHLAAGHPHLVLAAPHPSPLAAGRGFRGARPFGRVNAWLAARGEAPVDWAAR